MLVGGEAAGWWRGRGFVGRGGRGGGSYMRAYLCVCVVLGGCGVGRCVCMGGGRKVGRVEGACGS